MSQHLQLFQLGWIVGLIEGEGSIFLDNRGVATVSIEMTDKDTIDLAAQLLDTSFTGPYNRESKPTYRIRIRKQEEVYTLLKKIYPYLSTRRKEQASKAINKLQSRGWRVKDGVISKG